MTDEQKNRRAALARENGRKSRGPISPLGKYASSMNAIATGKHVQVHKEIFPECDILLSSDERESFEGVRRKLAYLFRNRLMAENIRLSGLPIDQPAIIDCIARRDLEAATRLVPDAAVEAFAVTGSLSTCVATVRRFFDAGIDEMLINVGSTEAERRAAFELIAAVNGAVA